jgi:hypothetical protein
MQPGPRIGRRGAQRLAEITPHHLGDGQPEAVPLGREGLDDLQAPAAFGQTDTSAHLWGGESTAIADDDPRARRPEAVADQYPAAFRAVHDGVGVQLADHEGRLVRVDRAVMPVDRGLDPVPNLSDLVWISVDDPPSGSAPPTDDHWSLLSLAAVLPVIQLLLMQIAKL